VSEKEREKLLIKESNKKERTKETYVSIWKIISLKCYRSVFRVESSSIDRQPYALQLSTVVPATGVLHRWPVVGVVPASSRILPYAASLSAPNVAKPTCGTADCKGTLNTSVARHRASNVRTVSTPESIARTSTHTSRVIITTGKSTPLIFCRIKTKSVW